MRSAPNLFGTARTAGETADYPASPPGVVTAVDAVESGLDRSGADAESFDVVSARFAAAVQHLPAVAFGHFGCPYITNISEILYFSVVVGQLLGVVRLFVNGR